MAEEKKEVTSFKVDFKCPVCNEGYLRPTGACLPVNPPLFPHMCNRESGCGYGETFKVSYPYIDYR